MITIYDDAFSISDLDSKNGTYVDGQMIGRLPVMVTHRAQLAFGDIGASIIFQKTSSTQSLMLNMNELKRQVDERMSSA